jgi:soluble P-type ATPase
MMITIDIPAFGQLKLKYLVCDFSGTLSVDGKLIDGVAERLGKLAGDLEIHALTADTHGTAEKTMAKLQCKLSVLDPGHQDFHKEQYVLDLGSAHVVAIGNGNNDRLMLNTARLGIAVCLAEGLATTAAANADIITTSINDALDLLLNPKRLIATLRF